MEFTKLFNEPKICECKKCKCYHCGTEKVEVEERDNKGIMVKRFKKAVQLYKTTRKTGLGEYRLIDVYTCLKCKSRWEDIVSDKKYKIEKIKEVEPKKKGKLLKDYNQEINVAELNF